ncbi:unnamed protein product [Trichobilharzia szidati]|nr:unnamed protein product [Trichobilharzia szidati]
MFEQHGCRNITSPNLLHVKSLLVFPAETNLLDIFGENIILDKEVARLGAVESNAFLSWRMAIVTCYFMSLKRDHISPYFPYISDAGSTVPESCIFGQLLNMASLIGGLCFYSWHKYILDCSQKYDRRCYRQTKIARIALCFGFISAFGMSLVANFQETAVWSVHIIGAALAFGGGSIYSLCVTYITYKYLRSGRIWITRFILSLLTIASFIIHPITGLIARLMYDGDNIRKWKPVDRGYEYHVASGTAEWITALSFMCFVLSLAWELKDCKLHTVKIGPRWNNAHYDEDILS